jgi:hypothetical protein
LGYPFGTDQRAKHKFEWEKEQAGMRNMIVAHIFETTHDMKEKKGRSECCVEPKVRGGILQALCPAL